MTTENQRLVPDALAGPVAPILSPPAYGIMDISTDPEGSTRPTILQRRRARSHDLKPRVMALYSGKRRSPAAAQEYQQKAHEHGVFSSLARSHRIAQAVDCESHCYPIHQRAKTDYPHLYGGIRAILNHVIATLPDMFTMLWQIVIKGDIESALPALEMKVRLMLGFIRSAEAFVALESPAWMEREALKDSLELFYASEPTLLYEALVPIELVDRVHMKFLEIATKLNAELPPFERHDPSPQVSRLLTTASTDDPDLPTYSQAYLPGRGVYVESERAWIRQDLVRTEEEELKLIHEIRREEERTGVEILETAEQLTQ